MRAGVPVLAFALLVGGGVAAQRTLPTTDAAAKATVDASPIHGEWMNIIWELQTTPTYIVHAPGGRSSVVVVVPDEKGTGDWIKAVGHELAAEGFTVLVPDLGKSGGAGPRADVTKRLNAVLDYGNKLPGITGKNAVVGFGAGSAAGLAVATASPIVNAAVVFEPVPDSTAGKVPVLGLAPKGDTRAAAAAEWSKVVGFLKQHTR